MPEANRTIPTTIFVVTSGDYSAYHIDGVFSTLERAEQFIALLKETYSPGSNEASVEEWPLDARCEEELRWIYKSSIDLLSGDISESKTAELVPKNSRGVSIDNQPMIDRKSVSVYSAISPEHASKLAAEARQKYLRDKAEREAQQAIWDRQIDADFAAYKAGGGH